MSTDNQAYRYFAFISYSSKDKAIAAKLQRQIENYRLPAVTRSELEAQRGIKYPKRLSPIFRDMTDLPAGVLGKSILRELEDSKYLIVICSPNSAKSEWVNQEVENFILMGRYERIIPYIVDGTPNSGNPATEAFPPILRSTPEFLSYDKMTLEENAERQEKLRNLIAEQGGELKGLSVQAEGPYVAKLKTVARMLEVAPDTLIQRDKVQQRKNWGYSMGSVAAFLLLCCCIGWFVWDKYYRVHVGYYVDYVERWGVPEGIHPLTQAECSRRSEHYRIYTRAGKVRRLEHVNSAGTPIPIDNSEFKDRPMIADYVNYLNGQIKQINSIDRNGKILISYVYSGNNLQTLELKQIKSDGTENNAALSNLSSIIKGFHESSETKSQVGRMELTRNEAGFVTRCRFQKSGYDTYVSDELGIAGFDYKLDEKGRIIEKVYLDVEGNPCPTKNGVIRRTIKYDENDNLTEVKYYDQNDELTFNELGWMWRINTFNENGNAVKEEYFDRNKNYCLDINHIAGWDCKYNNRGYLIECSCFSLDGQPCFHRNGYVKCIYKYDKHGYIIEIVYLGLDGKPCLRDDGIANMIIKYDKQGNMLKTAYFGLDNKPCLCKDGYAKIVSKYDKYGNRVMTAYFGVDDKLCLHKNGCAKTVLKYNELGNAIKTAFFNLNNEPCLCNNGYASVTAKYDERGNLIEYAYFDIDGLPRLNNNNYADMTLKYNAQGNMTEIAYFNMEGKPCLNKDCISKITKTYDKHGFVTKESYFGIDNKLCLNNTVGYAYITLKYDKWGKKIAESYFGTEGQPYLCNKGYANIVFKYNVNEVEEMYFGTDGNPCSSIDGFAKLTKVYNDRGFVTEVAYFGENDKPCLCNKGYARMISKYNERGNIIEIAYFNIDGQLCASKTGLAKITKTYDEHGFIIEEAYFGADNQPCLCNNGYSNVISKYNERGKKIEESYFGTDGQLCLCNQGYARCIVKYDTNGTLINGCFFDNHGELINTPLVTVNKILMIKQILPNTQAANIGLKENDLIVLYDRYPFGDVQAFIDYRKSEDNLKYHQLFILRDDEIIEFKIKSGELGVVLESAMFLNGKIDSAIKKFVDKKTGQFIVIKKVLPNSQAEYIGLKEKDLIIAYDNKDDFDDIHSFSDYRNLETGDQSHQLVIFRNDEIFTLEVKPGKLGVKLETTMYSLKKLNWLSKDSGNNTLTRLKNRDCKTRPISRETKWPTQIHKNSEKQN